MGIRNNFIKKLCFCILAVLGLELKASCLHGSGIPAQKQPPQPSRSWMTQVTVGALGRIHWQMHPLGFSKTAWDTGAGPAAGLSPGLSPSGFGFVALGDELRELHVNCIFQS
jgi:hypothetical protein